MKSIYKGLLACIVGVVIFLVLPVGWVSGTGVVEDIYHELWGILFDIGIGGFLDEEVLPVFYGDIELLVSLIIATVNMYQSLIVTILLFLSLVSLLYLAHKIPMNILSEESQEAPQDNQDCNIPNNLEARGEKLVLIFKEFFAAKHSQDGKNLGKILDSIEKYSRNSKEKDYFMELLFSASFSNHKNKETNIIAL